jgi:hypothetical protein
MDNSVPSRPPRSAKGWENLRRNLKASDEDGQERLVRPLEMREESLEPLLERGFEPKEADNEDSAEHLLDNIGHALRNMPASEWAKQIAASAADADDISLLVETLEKHADTFKTAGQTRFLAVLAYLKVLRFAPIGAERSLVRVSDYLEVMQLRERARVGAIKRVEVSYRALGRRFGVDGKTIKAWDKRAKQFGVTLDDWDYVRLRQIMRPSRRAPP